MCLTNLMSKYYSFSHLQIKTWRLRKVKLTNIPEPVNREAHCLNPDLPAMEAHVFSRHVQYLSEPYPSLFQTQHSTLPAWIQSRQLAWMFLWSQLSVFILKFAFVLQLLASNSCLDSVSMNQEKLPGSCAWPWVRLVENNGEMDSKAK